MNDPDPPSRRSPRQGWLGLVRLFDFFRGTAEAAADETPKSLTEAGGELVRHARAFEELRVGDLMRRRPDIVAVERSCTFAEVTARFVEAEHSRMPVYKETLDEPVGVVHMKDVFKLLARKTRQPKPDDRILMGRHHLVREGLYVPPSMSAAQLLTTMRARRIHLALVIDEFGGTDGLVTLEDLLETLVGDIDDEHDEAGDQGFAPIVHDDEGWIVDGRAPLEELEQAIGDGADLAAEALDEEIDTVAGLLNALVGRVPQKNETIEHPDGFTFEVLAADPRRVKRVRVRLAQPVDATAIEA
ncbi:hemolysin family protein [Phenylobacterium sp. SCN 70-31]|uniref:transporter associated domain-containing protein n=1 Tax=Phenylobacterium sp. SCN 70-31 TaxID=1660129 RepID=UPI00086A9A9E|nr:hemolysin family protein [Phenylobacterium sp. SCN 70-31]ODT88260.1 MAG: magnesium/cobalt efflux protein [Phenylobacterium sp. SCN 70-31]